MMGRKTSQILIAMVVIMLMAIAAYVKLWSIDYQISSKEALLLRHQFDLANREAMDESAEWRQRFDVEVQKNKRCIKELDERFDVEVQKNKRCIKELDELRKSHKVMGVTGVNQKLEMSEKENMDLLERIEILKQELEAAKFNCSMRQF